jgi:hypothetical protein
VTDRERAEKLVEDLWGSNLVHYEGTLAEILEKQFAEVRKEEQKRIFGDYRGE